MLKFFIKKTKYLLAVSAMIAAVFFADRFLFKRTAPPAHSDPLYQDAMNFPVPMVEIGNTKIAVELATSSTAIQQGLSGRAVLAPDRGMLFIFPKLDSYRFWMPDMRFPIDIIWLNAHNKIVDIDENVSNEFDPAKPVFFTPNAPVQYVLEVNAGFSKSRGIRIGDTAIFNHPE